MGLVVKNINSSLRFCLTVLKVVGFLKPKEPTEVYGKIFFNVYWFSWFMFLCEREKRIGSKIRPSELLISEQTQNCSSLRKTFGDWVILDGCSGITIAQTGAMFQIWGDLTLMTSAAFLLFTNLALATKMLNIVMRRREVQDIIDAANDELSSEDREEGIEIIKSCNRETTISLCVYIWLSGVTVVGWAASAEKNQLPLRAWYPYNTSKSPAYEITYVNQISPLLISAMVNVCLDTLVTSLIAVCCCRLRLVCLSLRTLCTCLGPPEKLMLRMEDEDIVRKRIKQCTVKHEAVLETAAHIQSCFEKPILAQFTVSIVIICVTAYQLALEFNNKNWIRIISMIAYLLCMMLQVFLYCYQGNQLSEESAEISGAAYSCPWYLCSASLRRSLLIIMARTRSITKITALGFTTLSLSCFTSIIKVSYTFFTVLKQVEDRK